MKRVWRNEEKLILQTEDDTVGVRPDVWNWLLSLRVVDTTQVRDCFQVACNRLKVPFCLVCFMLSSLACSPNCAEGRCGQRRTCRRGARTRACHLQRPILFATAGAAAHCFAASRRAADRPGPEHVRGTSRANTRGSTGELEHDHAAAEAIFGEQERAPAHSGLTCLAVGWLQVVLEPDIKTLIVAGDTDMILDTLYDLHKKVSAKKLVRSSASPQLAADSALCLPERSSQCTRAADVCSFR
jgi:hypothetical protein